MKKTETFVMWKIMLGSLPRGIGAFVIAVAGLSIGLPLAVFVVGLPLLAGMLLSIEKFLDLERSLLARYRGEPSQGKKLEWTDLRSDERLKGWRGWLGVLGDVRNLRGLVYGIGHFPVSILAFVLAIVIPAVSLAMLLSPLAELVSTRWFGFDLYANEVLLNWAFPEWTGLQRSLFNAGLGAILLASSPFLLRTLGGYYAAWIDWLSGKPGLTRSESA